VRLIGVSIQGLYIDEATGAVQVAAHLTIGRDQLDNHAPGTINTVAFGVGANGLLALNLGHTPPPPAAAAPPPASTPPANPAAN
jgi:hypothetical protein